jgi:hypothetical protein
MTVASLVAAVTLTLPSWGNGAPPLLLDVPAGYTSKQTKGPDFDVFYISSKTSKGTIGIYVGHHPREQVTVSSRAAIRWRVTDSLEGGQQVYGAEAVLQGVFNGQPGPGVSALLVHVMVRGPDRVVVESLKAAAGTIRIGVAAKSRQWQATDFLGDPTNPDLCIIDEGPSICAENWRYPSSTAGVPLCGAYGSL